MEELKRELHMLQLEKEALSYKRFWDGADYARNREITDKIYRLRKELASK